MPVPDKAGTAVPGIPRSIHASIYKHKVTFVTLTVCFGEYLVIAA